MALQQQILPIYAGCQILPCRGINRHSTQVFCKGCVFTRNAGARNRQFKMALLWHTFDAADQPLRVQRDFFTRLWQLADADGRRQNHIVRIAVIDHIGHRDALGQWPSHLARFGTFGQLPLQADGRARVARIFPVSMPIGAVLQLQPQAHGLTHLPALGRV